MLRDVFSFTCIKGGDDYKDNIILYERFLISGEEEVV
jgi:hypothetical protein